MNSTLLDLVLIAFILLALVRGYQRGFVVSLLGFVGFVVGGVAALAYAPRFITDLNPGTRLLVLIFVVLLGANLLQALTVFIANAIRKRLLWKPLRVVDSLLGMTFTVVGTILMLWGLAAVLRVAPFASLSTAVADSRVISVLDARVPDIARQSVAEARKVIEGSNFPQVFAALGPEPYLDSTPPDSTVTSSPAVKAAFESVVKINGSAPSCRRLVEGSGFVIDGYVMTNAHVVAGVNEPSVLIQGRRLPGTVVYFDPKKDIALLHLDRMPARELQLATGGEAGDSAVVAGYPGNGPFSAIAARIRGQITALGEDIYGRTRVSREVYAITASVRPGNSGGPLISNDGRVLGMVFARSVTDQETGYALTAEELRAALAKVAGSTTGVAVGGCD